TSSRLAEPPARQAPGENVPQAQPQAVKSEPAVPAAEAKPATPATEVGPSPLKPLTDRAVPATPELGIDYMDDFAASTGEAPKCLYTDQIKAGDLPYTAAAPRANTLENMNLPQSFDQIPQVSVKLPEERVLLASRSHNGSSVVVEMATMADPTVPGGQRPVAVRWDYGDAEGLARFTLSTYQGGKIAEGFNTGPKMHGICTDPVTGRTGIVMDIVPGDFPETAVGGRSITPQTVRDLVQLNDALKGAGKQMGGDLQYFVTPDGRIQVIDQGAMLNNTENDFVGELKSLLNRATPEVRASSIENLKAERPDVYRQLQRLDIQENNRYYGVKDKGATKVEMQDLDALRSERNSNQAELNANPQSVQAQQKVDASNAKIDAALARLENKYFGATKEPVTRTLPAESKPAVVSATGARVVEPKVGAGQPSASMDRAASSNAQLAAERSELAPQVESLRTRNNATANALAKAKAQLNTAAEPAAKAQAQADVDRLTADQKQIQAQLTPVTAALNDVEGQIFSRQVMGQPLTAEQRAQNVAAAKQALAAVKGNEEIVGNNSARVTVHSARPELLGVIPADGCQVVGAGSTAVAYKVNTPQGPEVLRAQMGGFGDKVEARVPIPDMLQRIGEPSKVGAFGIERTPAGERLILPEDVARGEAFLKDLEVRLEGSGLEVRAKVEDCVRIKDPVSGESRIVVADPGGIAITDKVKAQQYFDAHPLQGSTPAAQIQAGTTQSFKHPDASSRVIEPAASEPSGAKVAEPA
ncbi:MAG: hypothetical protein WCG06_04445, partial [Candidatus Omnitrophota bacterium]